MESVTVNYTISKSVEEVFDAVVNQEKITQYFVSRTTGDLKKGAELTWFWDDYGVQAPVRVLKTIDQEFIQFEWGVDELMATVTMIFTKKSETQTQLKITEGTFEFTEAGVKKMLNQTQGWTDFCCSLKAYLYVGINLRK